MRRVENAAVTAIGISADNEDFARLLDALGTRTAAELRTAIDRTRAARDLPALVRMSTADKQHDRQGEWKAAEYVDGLKLRKAISFSKESVGKHFRSVAPPPALLAEGVAWPRGAGARSSARANLVTDQATSAEMGAGDGAADL